MKLLRLLLLLWQQQRTCVWACVADPGEFYWILYEINIYFRFRFLNVQFVCVGWQWTPCNWTKLRIHAHWNMNYISINRFSEQRDTSPETLNASKWRTNAKRYILRTFLCHHFFSRDLNVLPLHSQIHLCC